MVDTLTPDQKCDGVLALIGGFSLHLTLGTLYCFGNMNTYMTSYLRKHVNPEITYADMVWIPTLSTMGQGIFMTFSGNLEEKLGVRFTILIGAFIMTSGVYLTSLTIQTSVFLTVVTYGLMFGTGTALAYAPPLGVAMKWFPKKKGLVNGVIVGGFGLGAFVFNQVQSTYLNPGNEPLDKDGYFSDDRILDRVPSLFLLLGSLYGIIQMMAALLILPPRSSNENLPLIASAVDGMEEDDADFDADLDGNNENEDNEEVNIFEDASDDQLVRVEDNKSLQLQQPQPQIRPNPVASPMNRDTFTSRRRGSSRSRQTNQTTNSNDPASENVKPGTVVKTKEFWILWATFFLNTQAITYINSMYKAYGQQFINDDHFLAFVGAFAAIFNAGGRILWGHLCDNLGYKRCMMIITINIAGLYGTLYWVHFGGKFAFALWIWGIFFSFCANFVLLPTATAQCFGTKYSSKNYGLVMTGQAAAAPVTALLTQFLNPRIGWLGMFIIISCCSLACTVLTVRFPAKPSPRGILDKQGQRPSQL